jgi:RimJ/RimL family protein N-acetyltransferase
MLAVSRDPILTPRAELRRTRLEDAPALFQALKAPEIYTYLPRRPPRDAGDMALHFARIMEETAPNRGDQWLNWTAWRRSDNTALGTLEATVRSDCTVVVGYVFGLAHRGQGYARECVGAMIEALAHCGARAFEAIVDVRNERSQGLARALGFRHEETRGIDQIWRRGAYSP